MSEEQKKEQSIADRLHDSLAKILGSNWRKKVKIEIRPADFYWIVFLAEVGLKAQKEKFKEAGNMGASEVMSLASWAGDLEEMVNEIEKAVKKGKK